MITSFVLGLIVGAAFITMLSFLLSPSIAAPTAAQQSKINKAFKEIELIGSIKYRIEKVNELTKIQLGLLSQMDRPNASAAHSRYKNDIARQMKQIEEEKMSVFRSIIKDGFDPNLSIQIDGKPQSLKMSEVVSMYDGNQPNSSPQKKTDPISPSREEKRLRLVVSDKGNHDEQAPNPSNPTIH